MSSNKQWNHYATDGKCHNSQDGEHECGAAATWLGERDTIAGPWQAGFCDHCRREGREAQHMTRWSRFAREPQPVQRETAAATPTPAVVPSASGFWAAALQRLNAGAQS